MCTEYSSFVIRTSEGRRESVAPEDLDRYLEDRQAILDYLRQKGV